ncbi:MAG: hypothetical protein MI748_13775 [Opitutales bacterium]|nr:hypothetical protein [Opitutales bacterium]
MHSSEKGFKVKSLVLTFVLVMGVASVFTIWAAEETGEKSSGESVNKLDTTPPRGNPELTLDRVGWDYDCMECHRSLESKWTRDHALAEHFHIRLDHGNNRFCLNCHHSENRNAYVDYDGSEIKATNTVALCAKCHGTVHQDWEAGVHGRKNGYWEQSAGDHTRLSCSQCHDPHSPAFKPMKPLAAPTYPARAAGQPDHSASDHYHH